MTPLFICVFIKDKIFCVVLIDSVLMKAESSTIKSIVAPFILVMSNTIMQFLYINSIYVVCGSIYEFFRI